MAAVLLDVGVMSGLAFVIFFGARLVVSLWIGRALGRRLIRNTDPWAINLLTLLIGSGRVITLPVLLFSAASGGNPVTIAALALIFLAPPTLVILATARQLHGGEIREQY
mgnify:CR=1 FL=1